MVGTTIVRGPKDFSHNNFLSLQDIHGALTAILFPEVVPAEKRFHLTESDYHFLYTYLCMYPRESDYPRYSPKYYGDSYKKYLVYGARQQKIENDSIRIFNIVGQSYGYLSDCAYIVNYDRKIEFMVSAVLYVNKNEIFNDGKYEYTTIGFPFLEELGKALYTYELKREKENPPDLSRFKANNASYFRQTQDK